MKVAVWIIAASVALLALGLVVMPFIAGVNSTRDAQSTFNAVAAEMDAQSTFDAVADSLN